MGLGLAMMSGSARNSAMPRRTRMCGGLRRSARSRSSRSTNVTHRERRTQMASASSPSASSGSVQPGREESLSENVVPRSGRDDVPAGDPGRADVIDRHVDRCTVSTSASSASPRNGHSTTRRGPSRRCRTATAEVGVVHLTIEVVEAHDRPSVGLAEPGGEPALPAPLGPVRRITRRRVAAPPA